jgi:hypothetical protein
VGDHAVTISDAALVLIDMRVDHTVVAKVTRAGEASLDIFNRSIKAIYANSISEANAIIEAAEELKPGYHTLSATTQKMRVKEAVAVTAIANSMHRISEYSSDIAEILINQMIGTDED